MNVSLSKQLAASDLTIIPLFQEEGLAARLKSFFEPTILTFIQSDFEPKTGQVQSVYSSRLGRVVLLGLGAKKDLSLAEFRRNIQTAILTSKNFDIDSLQIMLPDFPNPTQFLEMVAFAAVFGCYKFDYYKQNPNKREGIKNICIVSRRLSQANQQAVKRGQILAEVTNNTRDLANHPANTATPRHLASHALAIGKRYRIKTKILDEQAIKKEKLGLLAGVSLGSDEPPRFIIMEYRPARLARRESKRAGRQAAARQPIVLIGKGLTFDSGGVSIKPADKMDEMKFDMCGGATVLGVMEAAARLKLNQHLVGIIPSSENLLSGRALKPGDVLYSHSGQTVEVVNTDAEGRLILADAISYAKKYYDPKAIIDYATLTGAVIVALGDEYTGAITNTNRFNLALTYGAETSGEKIAFLPLAQEYQDQLASPIADMRNVGEKGVAGAITAALFLEKFVGATPWVHLDTAGTAWSIKTRKHRPAGATGWGVYFTLAMLSKLK